MVETRRIAVAGLLVLGMLALGAGAASAQSAPRKCGRGLAGMTTSFLDLPGHVVAETREEGLAMGLTVGVAKGAGMIVTRTLVGVYEFVTAPFPVPAGYRPILEPEFPWGHFEE